MPNQVQILIYSRDLLNIRIWKEDNVFVGSTVAFEFHLRDLAGNRVPSTSVQVFCSIYPVDAAGAVSNTATVSGVATPDSETSGLFRMNWNSTGATPGNFLVRVTCNVSGNPVVAQDTFQLQALTPVEV